MAKVKPRNKLRFALWGAEESGLVGSTNYVEGLSQAEKDRIALYLNFDMIGSPNHVFFVYDGDDSDGTGEGPGPGGSDQIEKAFESFYMQRGLPFKGTDFDGRWQGKQPGGDIFIHGAPPKAVRKSVRDNDWTAGCIAVSDKEIEMIYAMVKPGTPIHILP